jgi:hypothetical protein
MYHETTARPTTLDPQSPAHSAFTVPFDTVTSPGAYVCNWSGHLLRVPERSLLPGGPLALNIVGGEPLTVTKISENPDITLAEARGQASRCGLSVRF